MEKGLFKKNKVQDCPFKMKGTHQTENLSDKKTATFLTRQGRWKNVVFSQRINRLIPLCLCNLVGFFKINMTNKISSLV